MLREFLNFREETVRRRFEFELGELERRIHILEGFALIFDVLDEAIRIIRKSDGKADAAEKLTKRFELSDEQTDAILELKLYKLARLEIDAILDELKEKRGRAKEIKAILGDKSKLWRVIRGEIAEVAGRFEDKRRTKIGGAGGEETEFDAEDFIVDEEVTVILSRDGWLKRVREVKDLSATRLREGDAVLAVVRGSTKEPMAIFSNLGSAYVIRINDVPASTGYGEPVQKLFNFRDGERVVGALLGRREGRAQGDAGAGRQQARLRPALRPRRAPRAVDARRPPLREARRGRRDRRRRAGRRQGRRLRRHRRRARAPVQGRRDPRAGQPGPRRHGHQGGRRGRGRLRRRRREATRRCSSPRPTTARRSPSAPGASPSPRAAARATPSSARRRSCASPSPCPRRRRRC